MGDYTKINLIDDVENAAASAGIDGIEARFPSQALKLERSGIGHQRLAPGVRQPFGHRHRVQEEIYVILAGSGVAMIGDEEVPLRARDALRVPPAVARSMKAGPDGLELVAFGAPRSRDDTPGTESEMLPGWWGDAAEAQPG